MKKFDKTVDKHTNIVYNQSMKDKKESVKQVLTLLFPTSKIIFTFRWHDFVCRNSKEATKRVLALS